MDLVELSVERIAYSQSQNEAFVLILHELKSDLKLPIVIGAFEAQAIALEMDKNMIPPRPLTHDLFKIFAQTFKVKVNKIIIHKLTEGIFHSNMICEQNGIEHSIDARTSDAIAIALRFKAPIYTYKSILQKAGVQIPNQNYTIETTISPTLDYPEKQKPPKEKNRFEHHSLQDLKRMLNDCVENEDYELAAQIRDEITKREKSL